MNIYSPNMGIQSENDIFRPQKSNENIKPT